MKFLSLPQVTARCSILFSMKDFKFTILVKVSLLAIFVFHLIPIDAEINYCKIKNCKKNTHIACNNSGVI